MTPLARYLASKVQRPLREGRPLLRDVFGDFRLSELLGPVELFDVASADNSIEVVRIGGQTGLVFDHNYFCYVEDLLSCFFSSDEEGMQRHLNYCINRFLLEESLHYNVYELSAGLLHMVMWSDPPGANPLGSPPLGDAKELADKLGRVRELQFKFCVAHEVAHVALGVDPEARHAAVRRVEHLVDGYRARLTGGTSAAEDPQLEPMHQLIAEFGRDLVVFRERGVVSERLEEILCDNIAADALGEAAARTAPRVEIAAHDMTFAIDALFLLIWFLEALRFRLAAMFDSSLRQDDPDVARLRGFFASFQFLLTYLAQSQQDVSRVSVDVMESAHLSDEFAKWLVSNHELIVSNENLENLVILGSRYRVVHDWSVAQLRGAALKALNWL